MKKYYRFEMKDTNWHLVCWIIYFSALILFINLGWRYWVFIGITLIGILLASTKLKVIKKRD